MTQKEIHFVMDSWGEYDDYHEVVLGVFADKKAAEDYLDENKKGRKRGHKKDDLFIRSEMCETDL